MSNHLLDELGRRFLCFHLLLLSGALLPGLAGCSQAKPKPTEPGKSSPRGAAARPIQNARPTITLQQLRSSNVMGDLGLPLGRILNIEGKVLPDDSRRSKRDLGKTLLRVEKAGGKTLLKPVVMELRGHERKTFKPGDGFHLLGYETGAFIGAPEGLFDHVPAFTTIGYSFVTWFQLVKVLK